MNATGEVRKKSSGRTEFACLGKERGETAKRHSSTTEMVAPTKATEGNGSLNTPLYDLNRFKH
jgi:hypothetical protein